MKSFEELCQTLRENNSELIQTYQEAQKERKKRNIITLVLCVIIDILVLFVTFFQWNRFEINRGSALFLAPAIFVSFMIDNFVILIVSSLYNKRGRNYRIVYKEKVIKNLVDNFYPNAEFFPFKGMPREIYREGHYESYDRYHSDDYIEATIEKKYLMDMAEVHTEEKHESRDSNGHTITTYRTVFHGLFTKIMLEKSIGCELRITRASNWDISKDRLKMDSSEFEKYFNVHTTDAIVGMQILTADIMEEILAFQKEVPYRFDIYIQSNDLFLRFHCGTMFEINSFKNGELDGKSLKTYYSILDFIQRLTKKILRVIEETEI